MSCSASDSAPARSRTSTSGPTLFGQGLLDSTDLAYARQEHQHVADLILQRSQHRLTDGLLDSCAFHHRQPPKIDGKRSADTLDRRRVAKHSVTQHRGELGDIGRG